MSYEPQPQESAQALDNAQLIWHQLGYGVVDPAGGDCAVTVDTGTFGAADCLAIAAGDVGQGGTVSAVAGQGASIASVTSAGTNETVRYDTIYVDGAQNVQVEQGTGRELTDDEVAATLGRFEHPTPTAPLPSTTPAVVLAVVAVSDQDGSVPSAAIIDRRLTYGVAAGQADAFDAYELDETDAYAWSGAHTHAATVTMADDTKLRYGTGADMAARYDSVADDMVWSNETGAADLMALARVAGDLTLLGTLTESGSP